MDRQMLAQSQEEAGKCPNWGCSHQEEDARRVQEFRSNECVQKWVDGEVTSEGHCSYDVQRSDEGMGGRVSIITTSEVTVVGRDDWK
jgi:hypothetical protein